MREDSKVEDERQKIIGKRDQIRTFLANINWARDDVGSHNILYSSAQCF